MKGAARLAESFGVSSLIIGLTVVSIGTSSPELIVNVSAAFNGTTQLALGNVVGSNIANVGLILAIAGVMTPVVVHVSLIRREIPIAIALSVLLFLIAWQGRQIGFVEGVILVVLMAAVTGLFIYLAQTGPDTLAEDYIPTDAINRGVELGRVGAGVVVLVIGAQLMVEGATNIAVALGVSELVIGLTLVAFGTSLPELAATVVAALRKETDILVGNIIGSNIYNIVAVLGITAIIRPVPVEDDIALTVQFPVMIAFIVLMLPSSMNERFSRWEGITFIVGYFAFLAVTFASRCRPCHYPPVHGSHSDHICTGTLGSPSRGDASVFAHVFF